MFKLFFSDKSLNTAKITPNYGKDILSTEPKVFEKLNSLPKVEQQGNFLNVNRLCKDQNLEDCDELAIYNQPSPIYLYVQE